MENYIEKLLLDAFKHLTTQLANAKLMYAINYQSTMLSRHLTRMYKAEDRYDEQYPYFEATCQLASTSAKHTASSVRVLTAHIKSKTTRLSQLKASFFRIYKTLRRALFIEQETYAYFEACSSRLASEAAINSLAPSDKHRLQQERFEAQQQSLSQTLTDKKSAAAEARCLAEKEFEYLLQQLRQFFTELMEEDKNFYRLIGNNPMYQLFIERIEHIRESYKSLEDETNRYPPNAEEQDVPAYDEQGCNVEQRYQGYDDANRDWNYVQQV